MIVSHLQFADDTVIFCNNGVEEILTIRRILRGFQLVSALEVNFSKTKLGGVGIQSQAVEVWLVTSCGIEKLPLKYLGIPLGANPRRSATRQPIIDRVKKKLST